MSVETEQHYVYIVTLKDEIVYVGKGQGRRINHVLSGSSHNKYINEAYYRSTLLGEPSMEVEIDSYFYSSEDALKCEAALIRKHKPPFNVVGNIKLPNKNKPKNITGFCDNNQETLLYPNIATDIPCDYEDFKVYMKSCYEEYLELSQAEKPHPLKWYIYGKLISDAWINSYSLLEDYFKELTEGYEDKRSSNTGRPRTSFPSKLNMNEKERKAFYNMQTRSGIKYSLSSEDDISKVRSWLHKRRT